LKLIYSQTEEMGNLFLSLSLNYIIQSIHIVDLKNERFLNQSRYYKKNHLEFMELTERYGEYLRGNYIIPSTVRYIDSSMGRGLFTEKFILAHEYIGEYCGIVQRASPCKPVKDRLEGYATDYAWTYPVKQGLHHLEVNARVNGNELRFVNHSFNANCRMEHTIVDGKWVLFLIAQRDILSGEQITVDYGEEYWSSGHRTLVIL
jgi:hypothetical protein